MGRTIPPFRPALDSEIASWKTFRRGLRPEDRLYFDELVLEARRRSDAGSLAARPLISEVMFFSMLLGQQKRLHELEDRMEKLQKKLSEFTHLEKS